MTLSKKSIIDFRNQSEQELWNYVNALLHMQNAILQLEIKESNPDNLIELSCRALEVGTELSMIFEILDDMIEDE
jgi:hypothetical protein